MQAFIQIYIIVNIFIIGTLFGSFFSLATYRIPRKQDILVTRSYCPICKHNLNFFDLIPILSFIFLGGKCRYCKHKISPRYFFLELSNGLVFVFLYLLFYSSLYYVSYKFLIAILIYVLVFLIIGSLIMKSKMTSEEIDEVSKKSGVFIIELVIAFAMFTLFYVSSVITARNYTNNSASLIVRDNAMSIAINTMEKSLATSYDNLYSSQDKKVISGITYNIDVGIYKYSDEHPDKKDVVSTIEVNVSYDFNGKQQNFKLTSLKKKVI